MTQRKAPIPEVRPDAINFNRGVHRVRGIIYGFKTPTVGDGPIEKSYARRYRRIRENVMLEYPGHEVIVKFAFDEEDAAAIYVSEGRGELQDLAYADERMDIVPMAFKLGHSVLVTHTPRIERLLGLRPIYVFSGSDEEFHILGNVADVTNEVSEAIDAEINKCLQRAQSLMEMRPNLALGSRTDD